MYETLSKKGTPAKRSRPTAGSYLRGGNVFPSGCLLPRVSVRVLGDVRRLLYQFGYSHQLHGNNTEGIKILEGKKRECNVREKACVSL